MTSVEVVKACEEGDWATVDSLLKGGHCELERQDIRGLSPLIAAAKGGHVEVVRLLLGKRVSVDAESRISGDPALIYATKAGHVTVVRLLLEKGSQVNTVSRADGKTPLMLASERGDMEMMECLLTRTDISINMVSKVNGGTALHLASVHGHTEVVRLLLGSKAEVNVQDKNGYSSVMLASQLEYADSLTVKLITGSALHLASKHGHTEVVRLLLDSNAEVNARRSDSVSPLILASQNGHTGTVRLLLSRGADVNIAYSMDRATALHKASQNGHTEIIRLLLDSNAEVNVQDKDGYSPIMLASERGHEDTVRLLLSKDADVNLVSTVIGYCTSALHQASWNGHTEIVRLLLDSNAEVNVRMINGYSSIMLASERGHGDIVRLLLSKSADVNIVSNIMMGGISHLSALHQASQNGHTEVVRLLLDSNAEINTWRSDDASPLMMASHYGHTEIVRLLLKSYDNAEVCVQTAHVADSDGASVLSKGIEFEKGMKAKNINAQTIHGYSALMMASGYGQTETVELLLAEGACINMQDGNGWTALHHASAKGHPKTVQQLCAHRNIDVDCQDAVGKCTPLMLACYYGHQSSAKVLLNYSASKTITAANGETALIMAMKQGHSELLKNYSEPIICDAPPPTKKSHETMILPQNMGINCPFHHTGPMLNMAGANQQFIGLSAQSSSIPKLGELLQALLLVQNDWKLIGVCLGCEHSILTSIQTRERNDSHCLMEMLAERLKNPDPPLSWGQIVKVVSKFNRHEAEKIKQQFITMSHGGYTTGNLN